MVVDVLISVVSGLLPLKVKQSLANKLRERIGGRPTGFFPCSPDLLPALVKSVLYLKNNIKLKEIGYYEFGIYKGYSIWFTQKIVRDLAGVRGQFYGFDSFQGLPELDKIDQDDQFYQGDYAASYEQVTQALKDHDADFSSLHLVKGFFSKNLFENFKKDSQPSRASLILVDCDLYSSTVPVLDFVGDLIDDKSIILFDDYNCFDKDDDKGERRAFREFLEKNPVFKVEPFVSFGWHGEGFLLTRKSEDE